MNNGLTAFDWGMMIGRKVVMEYTVAAYQYDGIMTGFFTDKETCTDHIILDYTIHCGKNAKPILRSLDQITEEEKEEFNDLFWNNTIKIIAFRKNDQSIQANYKDVFDGRKGYIDIGINGIDWLRQKGFCLNPEWFESGLAIRYNPEKHGDW